MGSTRLLFLDDDPGRAGAFLLEHPDAVWVTTANQCLEHLAECWDEVHLDHDLGGERWVNLDRDDSGMAIVGWLCREPRPHLKATRFYIHSKASEPAVSTSLWASIRRERCAVSETGARDAPMMPLWLITSSTHEV